MKIKVMTRAGDEILAEVNESTTPDEIAFIAQEFHRLQQRGYVAFGCRQGKLDRFDPGLKDDVLFIAPLVGG